MVHFVGMPVMCCDMLQNSMHGVCSSIKTRNWYPVIKGYVVVFQTTPPLCSLGRAESAFSEAHCWLELQTQQWNIVNSHRFMEVFVCFQMQGFPVGQTTVIKGVYSSKCLKSIAKWYLMLYQLDNWNGFWLARRHVITNNTYFVFIFSYTAAICFLSYTQMAS